MVSYEAWGRAQRVFAEGYLGDPGSERPRREVRVAWRTVEPAQGGGLFGLIARIGMLVRWVRGVEEGTQVTLWPRDDGSGGAIVRFYVEDGALRTTGEGVGNVVGEPGAGGCFVVEMGDRLIWPVAPPE
jgi:hypothetical protein